MKKKLLILSVPTLLAALLFSFSLFQQDKSFDSKSDVLRDIIFRGLLTKAHFNDVGLDNDFSKKAFQQYLTQLDGSKRFFTKSDVEELQAYQENIDDEIKGDDNPLLDKAIALWDERAVEASSYYKEILSQPFDFAKNEEVELDAEKRLWCNSKEELKEEWRKYLKYQALVRYHSKIETQRKKKENAENAGEKPNVRTEEELEKEVRDDLMNTYDNMFDRISKMDRDDKTAQYFNSLLALYGPHTEFYPPEEKANFDIEMSGRLEGIGAQLSQADGDIKVVRIVPGSASWKQGELKEEDVILKVGQGEDEPVSVMEMPLKDAVKMIRGEKGTEVRLTVRKPDGRIVVIPIIRDVVILEESYAKSAILENKETGQRVGYIYLPSFYADFSGKGGPSSADDVKKELKKLKKGNVESVLLDLRFNGGGSLQDAVDMTGLFIEEGPVVQVNSKVGSPHILKDKNTSITYNGPLGVMTNRFSASASEILAGALQDYSRAVVIGSSSTFGKGTVQRFLELDYYLSSSYDHLKPLGSLKLTIQKFYRITGKSTQWKGVVPDVILPDTYEHLEIGERSLDFALPWDEITSQNFKKWDTNVPTETLAQNSAKRISQSDVFQRIEENSLRLKDQRDKTKQTLNLEKFMVEQKRLDEESEKYENLTELNESIEIIPVNSFNAGTRLDSIRAASMENWYKEIKKNVYIHEAMEVMADYSKSISIAATDKAKPEEE